MKLYRFDGQMLTSKQIQQLVSCMSVTTLLDHIKAGRNTAQAILCHVPAKQKPGATSQFVIGKSPTFERTAPSKMR
jgi:hypothetical protein